MRKILFVAILIGLLWLSGDNAIGASGNEVEWQVITSTGVTPITFSRITTEIYVAMISTGTVGYANWISTTPASTNFYLYRVDASRPVVEHTEEVQSSNMSIDAGATPPVHIRVQWKYWRQ